MLDLERARLIATNPGAAAAAAEELLDSLRRKPTGNEIRLVMRAINAIHSDLARRAEEADRPDLDGLRRLAEEQGSADREAPTTRGSG